MKSGCKWIQDAFFYHIYQLVLVVAPRYNEGEKTSGSRILEILEWIPHLKDMGVNAVYFGPVFQSLSHGYDTSDYYRTDSRLGTKDDFKEVLSVLHENGIRIVLDGVFNHVGRGFWAFNDVQHKLEESAYAGWFEGIDFTQKSPCGDNFSYYMWEGNTGLVKLNLKNADVCNHLLGAVKMWMDEFGIDGLRLDAADCIDRDFFIKLHDFTKSRKKDFWLMGEIIHGDYREWANEKMLDSVTNYECWKGIYSSHNDRNYFEIAYSLKRQFGKEGIYKNLYLYNFVDNHDVNRVASMLKVKENLKNVYTLLFCMPGIPSVYYGSEWGIEGEKREGSEADIPVRPKIRIGDMEDKSRGLTEHIKKLAEIRSRSEALKHGKYEEILVRNEQFVFARSVKEEKKIVVLNLSENPSKVVFTYQKKQYEVLTGKNAAVIL